MKIYDPSQMKLTPYLFFTGKGGVGKTTTACATATQLADAGYSVLLVSTDPASNLQDVFETTLSNKPVAIDAVQNLKVANFDPVTAAEDYRKSVIEPYRGLLPDSALENMEEQLSGSCTVEIAAFNEFAHVLTDKTIEETYDYILFDTAPTGHTLRMLELPSAWSSYLDENTTGVSCLGQLSGLGDKKDMYAHAVNTLSDASRTTLMLVSRPQEASFLEADRASAELSQIGISNQKLIVNGLLEEADDSLSTAIQAQQKADLNNVSSQLNHFEQYRIPLRPYTVTGVDKLRAFLTEDTLNETADTQSAQPAATLEELTANLIDSNKKIIFTMGKGGVGKTTVAVQIAQLMAKTGKKVHLDTTDPADHLNLYLKASSQLTVSHIDEDKELAAYTEEVLGKARKTMNQEDLAYIEEDLRSPCTQEIALFRAFAEIVDRADNEIVVIDTAPTGHTLLLLESTQSYARELERSAGEVPESIQKLLPRLQNPEETEVVMVTLPETTPVYESMRLDEDLQRAQIAHSWWLVNQSMYAAEPTNRILKARAQNEVQWINKVAALSKGQFAVVEFAPECDAALIQ
ncbi:Arsenical pump-driving ATPase [Alkalibacterium sp. AK22]|uniref:arsenical pump-driving ATPase n=1 Tax=Alkalibacterium sp. AK22 TaxID=1229520 RepID=UPI00045320C9|nr:arsenical pump-driving ATPase [Alkalibacterium sp. AK22]EXJ24396.1 Arsenical pump-driving ATPase [Alkalibacterium sp. AK22]